MRSVGLLYLGLFVCLFLCVASLPSDAEELVAQADSLAAARRPDEAIKYYARALKVDPNCAKAYNNLGNVLRSQGKIKEALTSYQRASKIEPNHVGYLANVGYLAMQLSSETNDVEFLRTAHNAFTRAVQLPDADAATWYGHGNVLNRGGHAQLAIDAWRYGMTLPNAEKERDLFSQLAFACQSVCDWNSFDEDSVKLKSVLTREIAQNSHPSMSPFRVQMIPMFTAREEREVGRLYAEWFQSQAPAPLNPPFPPVINKRIRVGYISGVFRNHALTHLMNAVFLLHSRENVDVFIYATNPTDHSEGREQLERFADVFRDLSHVAHDQAAHIVAADKLHILVDQNGWIEGARPITLAMHPAPVVLSYLTFIGTTGAKYIDYVVTDRIASPPNFKAFYSEQMIYMPDTYQVNSYRSNWQITKPLTSRSEWGLPPQGTVYCDFNASYKIYPSIFDTWMEILRRVPGSVMWLLRFPAAAEPNLKAEAKKRGIDPDRVVFSDKVEARIHLSRANLCDVMLDTPHYNGGTTTTDGLWAGVPAITLPMRSMGSRMGLSLMTALGMPELIVKSSQEYIELAVELAENPEKLAQYRQKVALHRDTYPMFDTNRWVSQWELTLRLMTDVKLAQIGHPHIILRKLPLFTNT